MLKHFAPFLKASFIFLLSLDSKSRAFLSKICWFVPITSLEKDETDPYATRRDRQQHSCNGQSQRL